MTCALAAMTAMGTAPAIAGTATAGWTIQASPNPAGAMSTALTAVACSSAVNCWAVGYYATNTTNDFTLAERWNGSNWSIVTTPTPKGAIQSLLSGVSCAGPSSCTAVGLSVTNTSRGEIVHALAEAWNGKAWAIQPTPLPKGSPVWLALGSVSCTAPGSCTAVGGLIRTASAQEQPLAEHWNGTAWAIQPTPNPHAQNGSELSGVSCTATNACTAVGNYAYFDADDSIFAMRWNGSTWARQHQPNPMAGNSFNFDNAVSCASATACNVVGSWGDSAGQPQVLAQGWNGTAWSGEHPPSPRGNQGGGLNGVSCTAPASCIAVGHWTSNPNGYPEVTLAEQWNGTAWAIQPTPNPGTATISYLSSVACSSSAACVAVGAFSAGPVNQTQTLTEIYTGG